MKSEPDAPSTGEDQKNIAPGTVDQGLSGNEEQASAGNTPYLLSAYHVLILVLSVIVTTYWIGPSSLVTCKSSAATYTPNLQGQLCTPDDQLLILFAFCFGALGSALTASRYVVYAVRYRNYDRNRILWQLLTPIHGGVLAVVGVYVAVGGLLALAQNPSIGPQYGYFIGGFSFLVGFSSELFVKRLISATEALFGETKNIESVGEQGQRKGRSAGQTTKNLTAEDGN